jgi:hypothetical protein
MQLHLRQPSLGSSVFSIRSAERQNRISRVDAFGSARAWGWSECAVHGGLGAPHVHGHVAESYRLTHTVKLHEGHAIRASSKMVSVLARANFQNVELESIRPALASLTASFSRVAKFVPNQDSLQHFGLVPVRPGMWNADRGVFEGGLQYTRLGCCNREHQESQVATLNHVAAAQPLRSHPLLPFQWWRD